jgi:hypothetical protein
VGRGSDLDHARRFIRARDRVDAAKLADEGSDLATL